MATRTHWLLGLGLVVALVFGWGIVDLMRVAVRQHQVRGQLEALRRERERLLAQRERLKDDPVYVEGLIRSTFKQARKGEYVIPIE